MKAKGGSTKSSRECTRAGRFLRELRQKAQLSSTEVGRRSGQSGSEIAYLETGRRRLSIRHLVPVLEALSEDDLDKLVAHLRKALRLLCLDEGVPPALLNYIFETREE